MNLDRLIHEAKNFAELVDSDIEVFLRNRAFGSENLNIEFKQEFPQRPQGGKYEIRDICKYIVGLSNEEGGLVIYGVSDAIKDANQVYPKYIKGLQNYPSLEDLSQWVKDRVHPLIASPSIRFFTVEGQKLAILKIPAGVNRPYCYYDPSTKGVTFFKKTSGGIAELSPDEIREFHRTQMLDQAIHLLRAAELQGAVATTTTSERSERLEQHKQAVRPKLENFTDFGLVGIRCLPLSRVEISIHKLIQFLEVHRNRFSETMRYFPGVETFQNGVSVGYFPRAIRQDIKSTARITLYRDGLVAFDALADTFMNGDKALNPFWLSYELQRQLQLAKALLGPFGVQRIRVVVDFDEIEDFAMKIEGAYGFGNTSSKYVGPHEPVTREANFSEIHDFDGEKRNVVIPVVQDIMDEVSRIFGFSMAWAGLWDQTGKLAYVRGLENQR